jgi:hypothetical protein
VCRWTAFVFALVCAGNTSIALSAQTPAPPTSPQELAQRYERAHRERDAAAVMRLFYWGSSTERTRTAVESFIQHDVARGIKRISIDTVGAHETTQYTQNGVTYRMTLAPVAKLVLDFMPHTERGGRYNSEQTSYFIGVRNGAYWLVTAEPVSRAVSP